MMNFLKQIPQFLREVRTEMEKVSWPGRDEVRAATIVIIVLVIMLAMFIGGVDFVVSRVLGLFFRL
jgi:preprotein translocase subunit SecE